MGLAPHAGARVFLGIDVDSACLHYGLLISSHLSCPELTVPEARGG